MTLILAIHTLFYLSVLTCNLAALVGRGLKIVGRFWAMKGTKLGVSTSSLAAHCLKAKAELIRALDTRSNHRQPVGLEFFRVSTSAPASEFGWHISPDTFGVFLRSVARLPFES